MKTNIVATIGEIARTLVADVVVQHALQRRDAVLEQDLQLAGILDAEAAPRDETQTTVQQDDDQRRPSRGSWG